MFLRKFLLCGTALTIGAAGVAQAQTTEPAPAGIGDVVVTAQKRAENLQDTPVTVNAVSQDTLVRQGVKDITEITRVAPEVQVQQGQFNVVSIRGLRTGTFAPTVDNPNSIHLDGAYLPRYTGLNGLFYDLERVEVLAGPQGTLYGRNSVGGAINIITQKPAFENGGYFSAAIGNYNSMVLQGAANIAVSDKFAIRAAGYMNSRDGYYTDSGQYAQDVKGIRISARYQPTERDNILVTGDFQKLGGPPTQTATITNVLKNPTIFTVTTSPAAGDANANNGTVQSGASLFPVGSVNLGSCPAGATCTSAVVPISVTDDPFRNGVLAGNNDRDIQNTTASGYNVQWDHDFGFATLTAQAAYRDTDTDNTTGFTSGLRQDNRLLAAGVFGPNVGVVLQHSESNSQEIRLTSNASDDSSFEWTAGLYRFNEHVFDTAGPNQQLASWFTNNNQFQKPGSGLGNLVIVQPGQYRPAVNDIQLGNTDAHAVFGQLTYTPSAWDALHVTLGARYNWETKEGTVATLIAPVASQLAAANCADIRLPNCLPVSPASGVAQFKNETKDFERATYKANIAYDLTDSNMVFATFSTGYASGGYALGFPPNGDITPPLDHSYQPMTIEAKEVGTKNRFFDDRLQVNLSAFYYDFRNYLNTQQVRYIDPTNTTAPTSNYIASVNAAGSKLKGANGDIIWLVTENGRFHVSAQYLEATLKFNLADFYLATADGSLARLAALFPANAYPADFNREGSLGRPKWTGNADYTHTFGLGDMGSLDAQLAWRYQSTTPNAVISPQAAVLPNGQYTTIPERSTFDFSGRYQPSESNWSITGYVRNLADEKYEVTRGIVTNVPGNATNIPEGGPVPASVTYAYQTATYGEPRTYGVVFRADF